MIGIVLRHSRLNAGAKVIRRSRPLGTFHLRRMAQFFAPNEQDKNDDVSRNQASIGFQRLPANIQKLLQTKRSFLDPNKFYPEVEITDTAILESVFDVTYEPVESWSEICEKNFKSTPRPGSFVEFTSENRICFGVVLREPYARFNPYHNRMIVLTLDNELVKVYPQDVTFAMSCVLDSDAICSPQILMNRFNESYIPRAKLVQILHQFMAEVGKTRIEVSQALEIAHSNIACNERAAPVCLQELVKLIVTLTPVSMPSYFHQSALLMSTYLEMCGDPSRWMIPGCVPSDRMTNLSFGNASNSIPPPPIILATPIPVFEHVSNFLLYDENQMSEFSALLEKFVKTPLNYDDLVLSFEIWDAKRHRSALKAMMYAVVYPHAELMTKLSLLPIVGPHVPSPDHIKSVLENIGLYNNPQNPLTDPLLSAGFFGRVKKHALIASSTKDIGNSALQRSALVEVNKNKFIDNFPHLRKTRSFFHDTIAYILPGPHSNLAISMEEINSRRFRINLHIADLATRVSPSSTTFAKWTGSNAFLENLQFSRGIDKATLFPPEAMHEIEFSASQVKPPKDYYSVGDPAKKRHFASEEGKQTCMTITFEYNTYLEDPMKHLSASVRVSFDTLQDFQFRKLNRDVLEKSLTGKLEPSILGKLKLFRHRDSTSVAQDENLDPEDHYNVNFIYNVLRRHFESRNRNYALSMSPGAAEQGVSRKLYTKGPENISTELSLTSEEEIREKTAFLRSESEILAGRLASEYAEKNHIPVFYESKGFTDQANLESQVKDEVLIRHDNIMLPDFTAASFFQIPYGRDSTGHVSTSAFLVGSNFLGMKSLSTDPYAGNSCLGLRKGFVNVVDATESMVVYLNQLQFLHHIHFTQTASSRFFADARRFSHLKALGYNLHGALPKATMEMQVDKLMSCATGNHYLAARSRKYWVLKAVEQDPLEFTELTCIVTKSSQDIDMGPERDETESIRELPSSGENSGPGNDFQILRAYCEELGIELDLLVGSERAVKIGTEMIATEILYVNPISGELLAR